MLNEKVLGTQPRARHKELIKRLDDGFSNPILHREVHGDKIYVPLDLYRIWNRVD